MGDIPVLVYPDAESGHSSGWSGSETSKDRAHERDADGRTATIQEQVLDFLGLRSTYGATMPELCEAFAPWPDETGGHSTVSSALTGLHKWGRILRLTEKRNRCKVYVLPQYRENRPFEPPTTNLNSRKIAQLRKVIKQAEARGRDTLPLDLVRRIIEFKEKE